MPPKYVSTPPKYVIILGIILIVFWGFMIRALVSALSVASSNITDVQECIRYEEKTYYSNAGTAMFLWRGSPLRLLLNGEKTRKVCVEWEND